MEKVVIVGDGAERSVLARLAQELTIPVIFKGFLERESVSAIYAESHLIILPSNTEGFPKVIAEAAAYGCVSIVSDISSIGQYIRHRENGMLLKQNTPAEIADCILFAGAQRDVLRKMAGCARLLAADFTFEHYNERIRNEIVAKG